MAGTRQAVIQSRLRDRYVLRWCADFVASALLWTSCWSLACFDFVAGAVSHDSWTCGSFSEVGGNIERKLRFGVLRLSFGSALAAKRLARAARVNLEALTSWQAKYFVDLEAQISWQAQHFVNLEVQISRRVWRRIANLEVQIVTHAPSDARSHAHALSHACFYVSFHMRARL